MKRVRLWPLPCFSFAWDLGVFLFVLARTPLFIVGSLISIRISDLADQSVSPSRDLMPREKKCETRMLSCKKALQIKRCAEEIVKEVALLQKKKRLIGNVPVYFDLKQLNCAY